MSEKGEMMMREAGRKGGLATAAGHSKEFYHENGKKGARRAKELIEQGKRVEGKPADE